MTGQNGASLPPLNFSNMFNKSDESFLSFKSGSVSSGINKGFSSFQILLISALAIGSIFIIKKMR